MTDRDIDNYCLFPIKAISGFVDSSKEYLDIYTADKHFLLNLDTVEMMSTGREVPFKMAPLCKVHKKNVIVTVLWSISDGISLQEYNTDTNQTHS